MKEITILAAPQAYLSEYLYERWMIDHTGTEDDFYAFLTTPSVERDAFLSSIDHEIEIVEGLGFATYSSL